MTLMAAARQTPTIDEFRLDFSPMKRFRREAGLTGRDLAESLRISLASWYRVEKGTREPTAKELIAVARALGTAVGHLYELVEEPSK